MWYIVKITLLLLGSCEVHIYFKDFSEKAAFDFLIFYDICFLQISEIA